MTTDIEATTDPARGRPRGSKNKPPAKRRNYAAELTELERRVSTALRMLAKADGPGTITKELVQLAMEELKGE